MQSTLRPKDIAPDALAALFIGDTPLIDVRAPVEFSAGHLPGAINLPLLNDSERAEVGTVYKQQGAEAATALGHRLVSGSTRTARLDAWVEFVRAHPTAVFYCFRGGQRSQLSRQWTAEAGWAQALITGGYKAARRFLSENVTTQMSLRESVVISGPTGAGKTRLLEEVQGQAGLPILHLEQLANHRGSAFGGYSNSPQPTQIDFENAISVALLKQASKAGPLLLEDESRMVGRCALPEVVFQKIRSAPVVWVDEPLPLRVDNILREYVIEASTERRFADLRSAISAIARRLGGARTQELLGDLEAAEREFAESGSFELNRVWIEKLLTYYYDPLYLADLERRKVRVLCRGDRRTCHQALEGLRG